MILTTNRNSYFTREFLYEQFQRQLPVLLKPSKVIIYTGKAESHSALELHVYYSTPCDLISYVDIFNCLSVPTFPTGTKITLMTLASPIT